MKSFQSHHWFPASHNVRDNTLEFVCPHVSSNSAESDLNLIGDANTSGLSYVTVNFSKISWWRDDLTWKNKSNWSYQVLWTFDYQKTDQQYLLFLYFLCQKFEVIIYFVAKCDIYRWLKLKKPISFSSRFFSAKLLVLSSQNPWWP